MKFIVHCHSSDESFGEGLPRLISAGDTLDTDVEQISNAIRTWVLNHRKGEISNLSLTLTGPMEGITEELFRSPEEKLASSKNRKERLRALGDAAKSRFNAGDFETAQAYALELQEKLNWLDPDTKASMYIVLGRLALREGQVQRAERYLLEAGDSPGCPTMDTFGLNMSLAHDLLLAGHTKAVLEYFKLCGNFWMEKFSKVDEWTQEVEMGRIPDFGANLVY